VRFPSIGQSGDGGYGNRRITFQNAGFSITAGLLADTSLYAAIVPGELS